MPLPFIIGAAIASTIYGGKKMLDANEMFEKANSKVEKAQNKYKKAQNQYERAKTNLQAKSSELGKLKLEVFTNEISHTVDVIKSIKQSTSTLKDFETIFSETEFREMCHSVDVSIELTQAGDAVYTGILAGVGAYGAVSILGTASTGTAIATLSGAAAKSATLAWLGGGSIATGGLGMIGGMATLGGVFLGPAVLVGGVMMASKAEQAYTEAKRFSAQMDIEIGKINAEIEVMRHAENKIAELTLGINQLRETFSIVKVYKPITSVNEITKMLNVAKLLKDLLNVSIFTKDGNLDETINIKLFNITEQGKKII
jgi:hypothetical protein